MMQLPKSLGKLQAEQAERFLRLSEKLVSVLEQSQRSEDALLGYLRDLERRIARIEGFYGIETRKECEFKPGLTD